MGDDVKRIVGVLVRNNEDWMMTETESGNLNVPLRAPSAGLVLKNLAHGEVPTAPGSGSLFTRFQRVNAQLEEAIEAGPEGAAAVMATLRLSALKQLPWYSGVNYQGKDMAHIQEVLANRLAVAAAKSAHGDARQLFRAALATMPRGGGNGDDIRNGILNVMRENGIKEGHRDGLEDLFLSQWHQKLHSNTTVDDIAICEAYIHFLEGDGEWSAFWSYLWKNYQLGREDLAGMKNGWKTDGIRGPANHLPHLVDPMKHFLWILKITHGGGSMDSAMDFARGNMPKDIEYDIDDMLQHRDAPWVPNKVVEIRERLSGTWRYGEWVNRDVVLLDIAMEKFYRQRVEGMVTANLSPDEKLGQLEYAIRNVCVGNDFERMSTALAFLRKINSEECGLERWTVEWAKVMDAALDSVSLAMEFHMDTLCSLVQRPADYIGFSGEVDDVWLDNFGEEVVRGHSMFAVSKIHAECVGIIRKAAQRSAWMVVSHGAPELSLFAGRVTIASLEDLQGQDFSATPMVLMSAKLGGLEDIPPGVTAVLTAGPVDLLSHIAIRCRQMGVLLAAMTDPGGWAELMALSGTLVKVDVVGEEVVIKESDLGVAASTTVAGPSTGHYIEEIIARLAPNANSPEWLVGPDQYRDGVVGRKSQNLSHLGFSTTLASYAMLSTTMKAGELKVPGSRAIPFSGFDRALRADAATLDKVALASAAVAVADESGDFKLRRDALEVLRDVIVYQLKMPSEIAPHLAAAAAAYGGEVSVQQLYKAVKKVWASKWNERAYLSRKASGVEEEELCMAVLLMELVPADYSFVIHTCNPLNGNTGEVFGEVCIGLGEALVGNEAGSAMSFVAAKTKGFPSIVKSLPSKPVSHHPPEGRTTVIARSDSNGEDLEGFAGAGLYESVTVDPTVTKVIDYSDEWLVWDEKRRTALIAKLSELAVAIEIEMGGPQDIEGCIVENTVYILQSRNQIF